MQNSCLFLASGCHPSEGNPCPEYCSSNCDVCAAGVTQLVAMAGGRFVPEHWAVIGLVSVGPNYKHLTKLQLSGHCRKQEPWHFCVGAHVVLSQLPVCCFHGLSCLSEGLCLHIGLTKDSSCSGKQKVALALKWSTSCWVNINCFPETSVSY